MQNLVKLKDGMKRWQSQFFDKVAAFDDQEANNLRKWHQGNIVSLASSRFLQEHEVTNKWNSIEYTMTNNEFVHAKERQTLREYLPSHVAETFKTVSSVDPSVKQQVEQLVQQVQQWALVNGTATSNQVKEKRSELSSKTKSIIQSSGTLQIGLLAADVIKDVNGAQDISVTERQDLVQQVQNHCNSVTSTSPNSVVNTAYTAIASIRNVPHQSSKLLISMETIKGQMEQADQLSRGSRDNDRKKINSFCVDCYAECVRCNNLMYCTNYTEDLYMPQHHISCSYVYNHLIVPCSQRNYNKFCTTRKNAMLLAPDVLLIIFSYLQKNDMIRASSSSKMWRSNLFHPTLWTRFVIPLNSNFFGYHFVFEKLPQNHKLDYLEIGSISQFFATIVSKNFQAKRVKLMIGESELDIVIPFLQACTQLESLELFPKFINLDFDPLVEYMPKSLTHLNCLDVLPSVYKLPQLELLEVVMENTSDVVKMVTHLTKLKRICLSTVFASLDAMEPLQQLTMINDIELSDMDLNIVYHLFAQQAEQVTRLTCQGSFENISKFPSLKYLCIPFYEKTFEMEIVTCCQQLEYLNINSNNGMNDIISCLTKLPNIKTFIIHSVIHNVPISLLFKLPPMLTLKRLELHRTMLMIDPARVLLDSCPNLKEMSLCIELHNKKDTLLTIFPPKQNYDHVQLELSANYVKFPSYSSQQVCTTIPFTISDLTIIFNSFVDYAEVADDLFESFALLCTAHSVRLNMYLANEIFASSITQLVYENASELQEMECHFYNISLLPSFLPDCPLPSLKKLEFIGAKCHDITALCNKVSMQTQLTHLYFKLKEPISDASIIESMICKMTELQTLNLMIKCSGLVPIVCKYLPFLKDVIIRGANIQEAILLLKTCKYLRRVSFEDAQFGMEQLKSKDIPYMPNVEVHNRLKMDL